MDTAREAYENHQEAIRIFNSSVKPSQQQEDVRTTQDQFFYKRLGDSHALIGTVTCNITLLKILLNSEMFQKNREASAKFISIVQKSPTSIENLRRYFGRTPDDFDSFAKIWETRSAYLSKIYEKTKYCLAIAVRRMTNSQEHMARVETSSRDFHGVFSENIVLSEVRKIGDSKSQNPEKLKQLEPLLLPVVIHNFAWIMERPIDMLRNFQHVMDLVFEIRVGKMYQRLTEQEQLCYITILFGLLYAEHDRITLKVILAKEISYRILKERETKDFHPEYCLFFVVLEWPSKVEPMASEEKEALFHKCIEWLRNHFQNYHRFKDEVHMNCGTASYCLRIC